MNGTVFTLFFLIIDIASDVINVTLVIMGEDCTDGEKLRETVNNLFM